MVWESCNITLNTGFTGAFYTGDIVTGSINFNFKNKQKLENITCEIIGTTEAKWSRSKPTIPYIKIYSEKYRVFDIKYELADSAENGVTEIGPGIYTYYLHFVLPESLPSTFHSSIGKVKYYIKVVGKSSRLFKKECIEPFVVIGRIDLNNIDVFVTPSYTEFVKTLWRSKGRVHMCLKTYKGFAPNQTVPFELVISNQNRTKISKIIISLIQKIEYTVQSGYANEEIMMTKSIFKNCTSEIAETCNFYMVIPEIVPSSINQSQPMIEIGYIFRVSL